VGPDKHVEIGLRLDLPMADPFIRIRGSSDDVRIRTALALSILVHAAALTVLMPHLTGRPPWPGPERGATEGLEVELVARAATAAAPSARSEAPAIRGSQRASTPARTVPAARPATTGTIAQGAQADTRQARETVPVLTAPSTQTAALLPYAPARGPEWWRVTSAALAQARAAPSVGGDLSSSIAARRHEHAEESAAPAAGGGGHDRVVAGMPAPQSPIDEDRRHRGGVFAITRMAYDDAEFLFFGWKDDTDAAPAQAIQVRLGANRDMRIAVVRRMIALIREHERGEFQWQSWRLGRIVELSARPEDSVGLEDFLLREFFESRQAAAGTR
jgi:hypothetical protein